MKPGQTRDNKQTSSSLPPSPYSTQTNCILQDGVLAANAAKIIRHLPGEGKLGLLVMYHINPYEVLKFLQVICNTAGRHSQLGPDIAKLHRLQEKIGQAGLHQILELQAVWDKIITRL